MNQQKGIIYVFLFTAMSLLIANTLFVWSYFQRQNNLSSQLTDINKTLGVLQASVTEISRNDTQKYPALSQASISTKDLSDELHLLISAELQPFIETQRLLAKNLSQSQSENHNQDKNNATSEFVDLEKELNAYEQSIALIDEIIAGNNINAEDSLKLHSLSLNMSEDTRRELRDRIVSAINSQQLIVSRDFTPPF